jgi:hypothetical protein
MLRSLKASAAGITGCLFIAYLDTRDSNKIMCKSFDLIWQYKK